MTGSNINPVMSFRFNAKYGFFTYPQAENLTKELILEHFNELGIKEYCICEERHTDSGKHFHAYIGWENPFCTRNERKFDIGGRHPNIQRVRSRAASITYCKKDGDYIGNVENPTGCGKYSELAEAVDETSFWRIAATKHPRDYVINLEKLEYFCGKKFKPNIEDYDNGYTMWRLPEELTGWTGHNIGGGADGVGRVLFRSLPADAGPAHSLIPYV